MSIHRRARVLLGTLTEVGILCHAAAEPGAQVECAAPAGTAAEPLVAAPADGAASSGRAAPATFDAAFGALARIEALMSRQQAGSDLARLNAAAPGVAIAVHAETTAVLTLSRELHAASGGAFDASCGSARQTCGFELRDGCAWRTAHGVALSLDGIAKGHAVDRAVAALRACGVAAGWVNAGGDLRVFGNLDLPVDIRLGQRSRMLALRDCALATSEFGRHRRYRGAGIHAPRRMRHFAAASVRAPECALADALTKVALVAGRDARHVAATFGAQIMWLQ
jgi:thiamine biosynthesis lipoprotein